MENRKANAILAVSTVSAITSGLAWLNSNKVNASPGGTLTIPPELMELLIAIAKSEQDITDAIKGIQLGGFGQGWPPNADSVVTMAVACTQVNQPYPAPDMPVPDGMALTIKSSPVNAVASLVYVSKSRGEVFNPMSAWPLIRNESIPYFIKNAKGLWVGSNVPGSIALFTVERRERRS